MQGREPEGSPPHMRGKVNYKDSGKDANRITPAHAGKSLIASCGNTGRRDHPRTCGEKLFRPFRPLFLLGSPPHMRGKVFFIASVLLKFRITPAHAGKSFFCPNRILWDKDHPRTCGEKCGITSSTSWEKGSPPHMRGKD